jgi:hypothetical protein
VPNNALATLVDVAGQQSKIDLSHIRTQQQAQAAALMAMASNPKAAHSLAAAASVRIFINYSYHINFDFNKMISILIYQNNQALIFYLNHGRMNIQVQFKKEIALAIFQLENLMLQNNVRYT